MAMDKSNKSSALTFAGRTPQMGSGGRPLSFALNLLESFGPKNPGPSHKVFKDENNCAFIFALYLIPTLHYSISRNILPSKSSTATNESVQGSINVKNPRIISRKENAEMTSEELKREIDDQFLAGQLAKLHDSPKK
ncbi:hypothetical protein DdX_10985 [Ditylenchus destructor]|uniref:Uncharacterized protein n=1 Tax=Ditylenchus destructor TaxID=166010 RepID=A0AAD4R1N1_9BILA|nr:hypothetical protein DdX_10985 [Ditylenchus destructor]